MVKVLNFVIYSLYLIVSVSIGLVCMISYKTAGAEIPQGLWTLTFVSTLILVVCHGIRAIYRQYQRMLKDTPPRKHRLH